MRMEKVIKISFAVFVFLLLWLFILVDLSYGQKTQIIDPPRPTKKFKHLLYVEYDIHFIGGDITFKKLIYTDYFRLENHENPGEKPCSLLITGRSETFAHFPTNSFFDDNNDINQVFTKNYEAGFCINGGKAHIKHFFIFKPPKPAKRNEGNNKVEFTNLRIQRLLPKPQKASVKFTRGNK